MTSLIGQLLAQREGSTVDFKTDASSPKKIVKDFVAFGNTEARSWSASMMTATSSALRTPSMDEIKEAFAAQGIEINESKLESYELAVRQNEELVPTHAGILLFGESPHTFLPDAYFRGIRYAGETKSGDVLNSAEWEGLSAPRSRRGRGFHQTQHGNCPDHSRPAPPRHPSLRPHPPREILHNAIAHADYSRSGQHLNISIFSDHLMIDSPSKLPAGMIVEYLEQGVSKVRNTAIMNVLHALGYVEKYGTVYAKAEAAAEAGYPIPEWSEPGPILRVTMLPHPAALPPSSKEESGKLRRNREDEIYEHLRRFGQKTAAVLAEEIELSPRQTRSYLRSLEKAGRVQPVGKGPHDPNRAYRAIGAVRG